MNDWWDRFANRDDLDNLGWKAAPTVYISGYESKKFLFLSFLCELCGELIGFCPGCRGDNEVTATE